MKHQCTGGPWKLLTAVVLAAGVRVNGAVTVRAQRGPGSLVGHLRQQQPATLLQVSAPPADGCGGVPTYANSKPKEYADAKPTFYNTTSKKTEPVTFSSGAVVTFKCDAGYTTDGSKDGSTTYDVECTAQGYFKTSGVCIKASKCGPVPNITHAVPTGKVTNGKVEFACAQGYSLDGQKVVSGGMGKNRFFELECVDFSGSYEEFKGECKAYAFMPSTETVRLYNQLAEVLFISSCKGSLKTAFGKGTAPSGLDSVCTSFGDQSSACQALVTKIKSDFEAKVKARADFEKELPQDWYNKTDDVKVPNISDEAQSFCAELWQLLALPSP